MKIHPTAIIEDGASIGSDVEVGPFAIIGHNAVVGDGCRILAHAILENHVTIGAENVIGYGTVIGSSPQDFAHSDAIHSEVKIGNRNIFREYVTVHRGTKDGSATVIGNDNFLMTGTHFGHNVQVGNKTIIANNCLLAGYCEIGDGAVLGGGTVFHQFVRIGRLCMVRGGTRFGKDIAPFLVADGENWVSGLNAIGLRRAGLSADVRMELKRLFKAIFRSGMNVSQAIASIDDQPWGAEAREMIAFILSAKRGICLARAGLPGKSTDIED